MIGISLVDACEKGRNVSLESRQLLGPYCFGLTWRTNGIIQYPTNKNSAPRRRITQSRTGRIR